MPGQSRRNRRQIIDGISDEMWSRGQGGGKQEAHAVTLGQRHLIPIRMRAVFRADNAARQARGLLPQQRELRRIERHRSRRAAIAGEHGRDPERQALIAVEPALHFQEQRHAPGNEVAKLAERHHALRAAAKSDVLERRYGHLVEPVGAFGQPAELGVMVDHGLAIGADLQVGLDAVIGYQRRAHGAGGVFDHTVGGVVQSAMSERPRGQPVA